MSPKLKPLLLPLLVEERRKRESLVDSDMEFSSSSFYSQASSVSEVSSPVTPISSSRGHLRYPSSASSIESTLNISSNEIPSSPTYAASKSGKRSLPDVQEEPQERDEDFDMFDDVDELYGCLCDSQECLHRDPAMVQSTVQLPTPREFDYDLAEGFFSDGDFTLSPRYRKRKAPESTLTDLTTRFENRFPSFSRKWRSRKGPSATSIKTDAQRENAASRAASSRSSSLSNSGRQALDKAFDAQMPPTPSRSVFGSREDVSSSGPMSIDIERAKSEDGLREEKLATTPLLPPLMTEARQTSIQSPLQSPTVAETQDPFSGNVTPIDYITTPQLPGMPSPPLSNKPSISSFHLGKNNRPVQLCPSSEIPPLVIADPNDEWAIKLGHANFTIHPEPYLPETFDLEACRQLRANWDLARVNYTKHLVRTGEHYGVTSKTYKLTEEKWAAIDTLWRKHNDITISHTVENGNDAFATLKHKRIGDANNIMTRIPSLNDPRSEGKFPQLGDEDIVGPMVQAAANLHRSPSKKTKLFKFFAEKFPASLAGRY